MSCLTHKMALFILLCSPVFKVYLSKNIIFKKFIPQIYSSFFFFLDFWAFAWGGVTWAQISLPQGL